MALSRFLRILKLVRRTDDGRTGTFQRRRFDLAGVRIALYLPDSFDQPRAQQRALRLTGADNLVAASQLTAAEIATSTRFSHEVGSDVWRALTFLLSA